MSRDENIFDVYRHGGAVERMDIYLAHPALRQRFDEIEREEERGAPSGEVVKGKDRSRLGWGERIGAAFGHLDQALGKTSQD